MDLLKVLKAEYIDEYRIKLWFNNGEVRVVDLRESLDGPMFLPLKELDFFKRFRIPYNTLEWENGADFAPEYLYEIGNPV